MMEWVALWQGQHGEGSSFTLDLFAVLLWGWGWGDVPRTNDKCLWIPGWATTHPSSLFSPTWHSSVKNLRPLHGTREYATPEPLTLVHFADGSPALG
jgi:hypothetical protein